MKLKPFLNLPSRFHNKNQRYLTYTWIVVSREHNPLPWYTQAKKLSNFKKEGEWHLSHSHDTQSLWTRMVLSGSFLCAIYKFLFIYSCSQITISERRQWFVESLPLQTITFVDILLFSGCSSLHSACWLQTNAWNCLAIARWAKPMSVYPVTSVYWLMNLNSFTHTGKLVTRTHVAHSSMCLQGTCRTDCTLNWGSPVKKPSICK